MQRTLAVAFASGLLASLATANIGTGMNGQAYLQAGDLFNDGIFGVPDFTVFSVGGAEPGVASASTVVQVVTAESADTLTFDFGVATTGSLFDTGGADVVLEFTLTDAATFDLTGALSGLTFFQSSITGTDNDFLLLDEMAYDLSSGEYFGNLVDGGVPATEFTRSGVLQAGSYSFVLTSFSETIGSDNGFTGNGGAQLTIRALPAPGGAIALAIPGLLLGRRRR